MSLIGGAKRFGGGLLDALTSYGEMRYSPQGIPVNEELAGDPGVQAARERYDRNYRVQRGKAIREGARWWEMNDVARMGADEQYESDLAEATKAAELLRAQRERSRREQAITDRIQKLTGFSDEEKGFLQDIGPDAAQKVIIDQMFPDPSTGGAQGAFSTVEGRDGKLYTVTRDNQIVALSQVLTDTRDGSGPRVR